MTALAYVDLNPVRAGLVGDAAEYPWSSARAHLAGSDQLGLLDDWAWSEYGLQAGWADILRSAANEQETAALKSATANGVACGDDAFVSKLEQISGRSLRSRKHGPTPQAAKSASSAAGLGVA